MNSYTYNKMWRLIATLAHSYSLNDEYGVNCKYYQTKDAYVYQQWFYT